MSKPNKYKAQSRPVAPLAPPVGMPHRVSPLTAIEAAAARGDLDGALALALQALARDPQSAPVHTLLAMLAVSQGRVDDAAQLARRATELGPSDPRAHLALGRALKLADDLPGAIQAYRRTIELEPRLAEAQVSLGIALKRIGDLEAAIACYQQALVLNPRLGAAHANLANALAAKAEQEIEAGAADLPNDEAIAAAARAVVLEPKNATLQRNHGLLLQRARRREEAINAFNLALGLDPSDAGCCLFLGNLLMATGKSNPATELFKKWLGQNEPSPPVMRALANLLTRDGLADEGLVWAEKAAALDPEPSALLQLCSSYLQCRRQAEALKHGQNAIRMSQGKRHSYPPVLLASNYLLEDPDPIFQLHIEFGRQLTGRLPARPAWRPKAPGERLKVGYVSGDFVRHSVSYFISGLLERHDTRQFEIVCYYNRGWGDSVTERLKAIGHGWVETEGLSDDLLYRQMRADGVDILVDLSGHTSHSRTTVFALGPAPLQVAYLGYPTISGVQAIDFRMTDGVIDPGDMPELRAERPLVLPRSMFCYRPDREPPIGPPPALARGHVTLGSFNNIAKVSDRALDLWARIMAAVPGSRLLLKSASMAQPSNRDNITAFMAARGIAAERLQLVAWIADKDDHLDLYNQVDIALDPYPYTGATTTCEALWMGVPVVTFKGRTHTSRMSASILKAAGKPEWVTDSDADCVRVTAALATDLNQLVQWRKGCRAHLAGSELMDEAGFTSCFEQALLRAWAAVGAEQQPSSCTSLPPPTPLDRGMALQAQEHGDARVV